VGLPSSAPVPAVKLADLVDLEWLLREGPDPGGADRDLAVGRQVASRRGLEPTALRAEADRERACRVELATAWLSAVRAGDSGLPGRRVVFTFRCLGLALVLLGALFGAGVARLLLQYDGTVPVNVLEFGGVVFGVQIVLLALLVVFLLRAGRQGAEPGAVHRLISLAADRWGGPQVHGVLAALRGLRARRSVYADVERFELFALAQRFGIGFNVAVLVTTLQRIAFSDLVFAWSSTLDLDPATVHALARAVALPWLWLPDAVPSLEVVEASQWARMPGTFVGGVDEARAVELAAGWWGFLVAGIVAWGLVPRMLALGLGRLWARRAKQSATLDHAGFQRLYDAMLPRGSGWDGPDASEVVGAPPDVRGGSAGDAPRALGAPTWVVVWGSLARSGERVADQLRARYAADVRALLPAGGADLDGDDRAIAGLRGASRVAFVAAAGQQPTADVLGFLRQARAQVGAGRPIVVGLLELSGDGGVGHIKLDERHAWDRALGGLGDPHLWVDALEVDSPRGGA
jgi:hypothetical protein